MTAVLNFLKILPATHVRPVIVVFLLMLFAMLLETLSIGVFVPAIGLFTDPDAVSLGKMATDGDSLLGSLSDIELILAGLGMLVCIFLIKSFYLSYFIWKQNAFSYSLLMKLTEELYLGYLRLPWLFHVQNNSAFLLRNINTEVNLAINNALIPAIKLVSESLVLLGITLLLLYFEPIGSIAVMIFMLLAGALIQKVTKKSLLYWGEIRQSSEGMRILQLQQGLGSAKEIKLLGRESRFVDNFRPYNLQSARAAQFRLFYQQIPRLFLEVITVGGLAVLIITLILQGKTVNTFLPIVGLFAAAVFRLMPSVNRILEAMQNLHYGAPSLAILDLQLKTVRQHQDNADEPRMSFDRDIVFRNVSFTYPAADKPVVEDLDLVITRGSSIGLIGSSGSGKTTLMDMLLGLMTPTRGEILVDGENIREHEGGWKKCLGYVPQHISLLDDSLQNNIAFGLAETEINTARLDRAVKAAQLEELVASLPDGLQTNIGEQGVKLSGGQRQRIGIARALYLDPQVLVLDEATSALDSETEQHIIDAINSLDDDKTIIIITHRLTTIAHCDTVFVYKMGASYKNLLMGKPCRASVIMAATDKPAIIITGGTGLLGLNWGYQVKDRYTPVLGLHSREIQPMGLSTTPLPLESTAALLPVMEALAPTAIIHTAGLTSIEGCEADPALAEHVNVELSRHVSEACREMGIPMIHISTDNLFDGTAPMVTEDAHVNPVNVYGQTKAEAEQVIQECHDDVIIVRTNFYGWGAVYKPSFSDTIIRTLRDGGELSLFEDVYYTPILISDLVNAAHDLLDKGHRGVFHVVGDERLSKYDFGHCVADAFGLDSSGIRAGRLKDMTNLASRPYDMSMSNEKTRLALGRSLGMVVEQLVRLRKQEQSKLTRSIHEVNSIR